MDNGKEKKETTFLGLCVAQAYPLSSGNWPLGARRNHAAGR